MSQHNEKQNGNKESRPNIGQVNKKVTEEQRVFLESQNQCALCNSNLNIKVSSYLEDYYIREEAECPHCEIKTRVKNHKMQ